MKFVMSFYHGGMPLNHSSFNRVTGEGEEGVTKQDGQVVRYKPAGSGRIVHPYAGPHPKDPVGLVVASPQDS